MQSEHLAGLGPFILYGIILLILRGHFVGPRELVLFLENDLLAKFVQGFWLLHQTSCIGLQHGEVLP